MPLALAQYKVGIPYCDAKNMTKMLCFMYEFVGPLTKNLDGGHVAYDQYGTVIGCLCIDTKFSIESTVSAFVYDVPLVGTDMLKTEIVTWRQTSSLKISLELTGKKHCHQPATIHSQQMSKN